MNHTFQIVYASDKSNPDEVHPYFKDEFEAMRNVGIVVGTKPFDRSERLMYRGTTISEKENYPNDSRYIHTPDINYNYLYLSAYYPLIADLSIETHFYEELDNNVLQLLKDNNWKKVFIKKDHRALEHIDENKSVYPGTSFEEMIKLYDEMNVNGKFAIRKYIERPGLFFENELRYWILNGKVYRKDHIVPDIVMEAVKRLNTMGGKYYTIDATPEFIIEVNPGESSDRHAENSAELFASWIKNEFVKK